MPKFNPNMPKLPKFNPNMPPIPTGCGRIPSSYDTAKMQIWVDLVI